MMIARPTAASPAAMVITKIEKICPSSDARRYEKATKLMLTALSINSIDINTVIMFLRMITPRRPTEKSAPDKIRYASVLGTHRLLHFFLCLDAPEDEVRRGLFFERAQLALADDDRADHRHE